VTEKGAKRAALTAAKPVFLEHANTPIMSAVPAKHTRPFNKGQKNDYNDAEAVAKQCFART